MLRPQTPDRGSAPGPSWEDSRLKSPWPPCKNLWPLLDSATMAAWSRHCFGRLHAPTTCLRIPHRAIYTVSQKNCANLYLSELCQISTNFDDF